MRTRSDKKLVPNTESKDFESVRNALRFIMETMSEGHRSTAQIHLDENTTLYEADIKRWYAELT